MYQAHCFRYFQQGPESHSAAVRSQRQHLFSAEAPRQTSETSEEYTPSPVQKVPSFPESPERMPDSGSDTYSPENICYSQSCPLPPPTAYRALTHSRSNPSSSAHILRWKFHLSKASASSNYSRSHPPSQKHSHALLPPAHTASLTLPPCEQASLHSYPLFCRSHRRRFHRYHSKAPVSTRPDHSYRHPAHGSPDHQTPALPGLPRRSTAHSKLSCLTLLPHCGKFRHYSTLPHSYRKKAECSCGYPSHLSAHSGAAVPSQDRNMPGFFPHLPPYCNGCRSLPENVLSGSSDDNFHFFQNSAVILPRSQYMSPCHSIRSCS